VNAGEFPQALQAVERILEPDPTSILGLWNHGLVRMELGEPEQAHDGLHRLVELTRRSSFGLGILAAVLAATGRRGEAEALLPEIAALAERTYVPATHTLHAAVKLGDTEGALDLVRRAVEERNAYAWWYLRFNPALAGLRQDPRCQALLEGLRPG
jgi:tetratricopeptide (TPR) repeat protein